jgi:YbgC/YbaW family acyl-CoA thioester hydrolase
MQKIVFNGHYLMYFDTAVAGYWRAMALPYRRRCTRCRATSTCARPALEYHGSARYDEQLEVGVRCARIGNSSMLLQARCSAASRCWSAASWSMSSPTRPPRPAKPVPQALRDVLGLRGRRADGRRAGGHLGHAGPEAQRHPQAVFVDEQGIPAELEWDAADADAVHAVAVNRWAWRWPPAGCWNTRRASRRSVAWPWPRRPGGGPACPVQRGRVLPATRFPRRGPGLRGGRHPAPGDDAQAGLSGGTGSKASMWRAPLTRPCRAASMRVWPAASMPPGAR